MLEVAPGWTAGVERGPDWLFLKLHCTPEHVWDDPPLGEAIWEMLERHMVRRVVIECEEIHLHSALIGQLVMLHKRVTAHGGVMRLCGLSDADRDVLRMTRLDNQFPEFACRTDAVLGYRPAKPR